MAATARGRMYARLIRAKRMTLSGVFEPYIAETKESYKLLYNEELEV